MLDQLSFSNPKVKGVVWLFVWVSFLSVFYLSSPFDSISLTVFIFIVVGLGMINALDPEEEIPSTPEEEIPRQPITLGPNELIITAKSFIFLIRL